MYKKSIALIIVFITFIYLFFYLQSVSVVVFCLICYLIFSTWKSRKEDAFLSFSIGLLVTIFFYEYGINIYGNHYYLGILSDDHMFETSSEKFYKVYHLDFRKIYDSIGILHNSAGYVYCISLIRYIGDFFDGYHTLLPRILNLFILQCLAHLVYLKGVKSFELSPSLMGKSAFWFSIFPSILFISQYVFRDIIVSFLLFYIYYLMTDNKRGLFNILVAIVCLVVLFYFRKNAFYIMLILTFFYLLKIRKATTTVILGFLLGGIVFSLYLDQINDIQKNVSNYDELNVERLGRIGSAIFSLPKYIGIFPRISFLLLNPIWGFSSVEQFVSGSGMIFQIAMLPFLWYGITNRDFDLKLKITFLILFLGVALSTVNFRHITMYFPFAILLIALSLEKINFYAIKYRQLLFGILSYIILTIGVALIL